jgi:hypothetical protein
MMKPFQVNRAAGELVTKLADNPDIADPEVPRTIEFVRHFLAFPGASAKRATFAMIRTIENLVASILRHSVDLLNRTTEKSIDGLSSAASKVIVGLLGVALVGATGIGPAAVRAGAPWVSQATEIVRKQIEKMVE